MLEPIELLPQVASAGVAETATEAAAAAAEGAAPVARPVLSPPDFLRLFLRRCGLAALSPLLEKLDPVFILLYF